VGRNAEGAGVTLVVTYRPLPTWPHKATSPRRAAQFRTPSRYNEASGYRPGGRVPWSDTLALLESEIRAIGGKAVVMGIGLRESDIRLDGLPRSNAPNPAHPGVELSFESRYGRLVYATDVFDHWQDNVRAIAKGLEALRAVERWGVSRRGEQYAGFAQLTAGGPDPERGRRLVENRFEGNVAKALRATHPDTRDGAYTDRDFADVQAYRQGVEPRLGAGT
jgi:hypothetical protein